jgi:hypothetical protein
MRRQAIVGALALGGVAAALAAGRCVIDSKRPFYRSYELVQPGMDRSEVGALIGGPGAEWPERSVPRVVDWAQPVESPGRLKRVVDGEQFLRWEGASGEVIILGFTQGRVTAKWYWEPSL